MNIHINDQLPKSWILGSELGFSTPSLGDFGGTMIEYSEQVRKIYSGMETEELLGRAKAGTLTEEAHALALEELQARGVPTSELPTQPSSLPTYNGIPTESPGAEIKEVLGLILLVFSSIIGGVAISWLELVPRSGYSGFIG